MGWKKTSTNTHSFCVGYETWRMFWTGKKTSEKSNEITAIPEPLELLDLKDGIGMVRSRRHNKKTKEDSYNWQQTKFMYQTPELP